MTTTKWFYTNNGTEWLLEIKYGNRVLQLAKDEAAIVVGDLANMVTVLEQVKEAVTGKELDKAIEAAFISKNDHRHINTTIRYIDVNDVELANAVEFVGI